MKLWLDDVRPAPNDGIGYVHLQSVNEAKRYIERLEYLTEEGIDWLHVELIDIDHDAGGYAYDGGDYIKLLDWLEETSRNYPIHIHSMNPVGVENMRRIIKRNNWKEVI